MTWLCKSNFPRGYMVAPIYSSQHKHLRKRLDLIHLGAVALAIAGLSACGGDASTGSANQSAGFTTVIEGKVIKGPVSMAEVKAFPIDERGVVTTSPISQSFTATDGSYRLELGPFQGPLQVVAVMSKDSTMRDEATGSIIAPPPELSFRAVTIVEAPLGKSNSKQNGQQIQTVTLSPFSELTTVIAGDLGNGKLLTSNVRASLAGVKDFLGFDPVGTVPVESISGMAAYVTPDRRMSGLALAAVSWLAKHGTTEDPQLKDCLERAHTDSAKRVGCASSLVRRIIDVDPMKANETPNTAALAFTKAIKQVEADPQVNKTGMKLSLTPSIMRLEQRATGTPLRAEPFNTNSGGMSGITAAKKLLESLRSNADAINIGMNEEGITSSLTGLGQSLNNAGNMVLDIGTLIDLINDGVLHWNDYLAGLKLSASFSTLPAQNHGPTSSYFACTVYSSFLPSNLSEAPFFGPAEKGMPYVFISPANSFMKAATKERQDDQRLIVDSTNIQATRATEGQWLGCSRYSQVVSSIVAKTGGGGTELNANTRYRQILRLRVDAKDTNGRPSLISYVAMPIKEYTQSYSASDSWPVTRRVNLLDTPLQGMIELSWNNQKIATAKLIGDLPASVDDTIMRYPDGIYASREQLRAAGYRTDAYITFVYNDTNTRINLPKLSVGLVRSGATIPDVLLETDPEGTPNYMVVPKSITCLTIPTTRVNLASRIKTPEGGLKGQVSIISPPDCGNTTEPVNGSIELSGVLNARNKQGQSVEVTNASLRVTSNFSIPTVLLEGRLFIPAREPMDLSLSVSASEATPTIPGTLNAQLAYKQGSYSLIVNGLEQVSYWGGRSGAFFSMAGSGGISAAWADGDKTVFIKENGKSIGEIDSRTGRVLFNDGSFQLIR